MFRRNEPERWPRTGGVEWKVRSIYALLVVVS